MRKGPTRVLVVAGFTFAILMATASVGEAQSAVDIALSVGASTRTNPATLIPNGGSTTVTSRNFYVFVNVDLITPAPGGRPTIDVALGGGLQWGSDGPDPTEGCTSTPTTGTCQTPDLQPITGQSGGGWFWDVVAPQNGTYTLRGVITQAENADPDPTNNSSSITIVVEEVAGGGGGSGGGGSGGGAVSVTAGAAKLSPAKPRAGSTVVASVRVSRDGSPLRPTGIACTASIGKAKLRGAAKAATGRASCLFKTPKSAKGKTFAGSISFRAGGQRFTERFSTRLG